jgi:hypothetical protein
MEWYRPAIGFFPVWCVPYRRVRDYEWISPDFLAGMGDRLFLDLAVYGLKQRGDRNVYKALEEKLFELKGLKALISYNYYDEDEFWRIWNKHNYLAVKKITDSENIFRDLYSKTCRAARGLDDAVAKNSAAVEPLSTLSVRTGPSSSPRGRP